MNSQIAIPQFVPLLTYPQHQNQLKKPQIQLQNPVLRKLESLDTNSKQHNMFIYKHKFNSK